MKLKLFFARMWAFLVNLFNKVDKLVEKVAPVAINIVEEIKKINESTTGDIIELILSKAIPGIKDDILIATIRARLKEILPKLLLQMNIANSISQIEDPNEQLKAIINAINMSPDETKNMYYHGLCTLILQSLSDGKLTWSESVQVAEYYYVHIYKK